MATSHRTPAPPVRQEGALGPYLSAIRAHKLAVAICVVAALLGAGLWLALRTPDYSASAQLLVTPLPQDDDTFLGVQLIRDSGDPTRTVQTAAALIETPAAERLAAERLGDDYTPSTVDAAVEVAPQGESNIIDVTATADSPEAAARVANSFAESVLESRRATLRGEVDAQIARLTAREESLPADSEEAATVAAQLNALESVRDGQDPTLALSQSATPPGAANGLSAPVTIFLALIAGATLGCGVALLMELANRRIRDEEEAVGLFPLPILARVPRLSQRELGPVAPGEPWQMQPMVHEAFRTLIVQLNERGPADGRTVMVTSACSGEGKSNTAVNLAVSIAAGGQSAILLDLDVRKPDIARVMGIAEPTELRALAAPADGDGEPLEKLLQSPSYLPSLSVLATTVSADADTSLVEAVNLQLAARIREARQLADYVILDTAPLGEISDALRVIGEVDDLIILTRLGYTNRRNFEVMRDLLLQTRHEPAGMVVIGDTPGLSRDYYGYGSGLRARPGVTGRSG